MDRSSPLEAQLEAHDVRLGALETMSTSTAERSDRAIAFLGEAACVHDAQLDALTPKVEQAFAHLTAASHGESELRDLFAELTRDVRAIVEVEVAALTRRHAASELDAWRRTLVVLAAMLVVGAIVVVALTQHMSAEVAGVFVGVATLAFAQILARMRPPAASPPPSHGASNGAHHT